MSFDIVSQFGMTQSSQQVLQLLRTHIIDINVLVNVFDRKHNQSSITWKEKLNNRSFFHLRYRHM